VLGTHTNRRTETGSLLILPMAFRTARVVSRARRRAASGCTLVFVFLFFLTGSSFALDVTTQQSGSSPSTTGESAPDPVATVACTSTNGARAHSDANTSDGVPLLRTTGPQSGFSTSSEYLAGFNFYPANTRNHRFNVQVINVNHSPVSSTFGYYVGGQDGTTVSVTFSVFF